MNNNKINENLIINNSVKPKENQRVRLTKQLLKNALVEIMDKKDFAKITIKEICEVAQTNRSTFYLHYTDQHSLLDDIENDLLQNTNNILSSIDSEASGVQYLTVFLEYVKTQKTIIKTLLCRNDSLAFQKRFIKSYSVVFSKNLALATIEPTSSYIHKFLMMGSLNILTDWVEQNFDLSCETLAKLIFGLCDGAVYDFIK